MEEEMSKALCGACGKPLYGQKEEYKCSTNALNDGGEIVQRGNSSLHTVSNHGIQEEQKISKPSTEETNILSSSSTTTALSSSGGELMRQNIILTCSNMSGSVKCCRSIQSKNGSSPHFHFGCIAQMIPPRSKLYSDICNYVHEVEKEKKRKKAKCDMILEEERRIQGPDKVPLDQIGRHSIVMKGHHRFERGTYAVSVKRSLPQNPFICELCDIQGSSQYLSEYFDYFRMLKKEFYNDDEAVDAIHPTLSNPNDDELTQETGFVKHLIEQDQELNVQVSYKPTELTTSRIRHILQCTARNQEEATNSSEWTNYETITPLSLLGKPVRLFCNLTNSYHTGRIVDARDSKSIDSSRLKSSSIQKYIVPKSPPKRSSRTKQPRPSSHIKLDRDIASTQYLVRFRSGIEGRKSTVHQWLYLEEHPLMVGVNIVWANVHENNQSTNDTSKEFSVSSQSCADPYCSVKGGDLSSDADIAGSDVVKLRRLKKSRARFYPGQIFLRSALEMMHVDDINPNLESLPYSSNVHVPCGKSLKSDGGAHWNELNVISFIFYDSFTCVRLNLNKRLERMNYNNGDKDESDCGTKKETLHKTKQGDKSDIAYTVSILGQPFHHLSVADFRYPPPDLKEYLEVLKGYDESLVHAIVSACCEEEEQRRLLEWRTKYSCVTLNE